MWTLSIDSNYTIVSEDCYKTLPNFEGIASFIYDYWPSAGCFYTDYIDQDGKFQLQKSYDRIDVSIGLYPKLCYVVRNDILNQIVYDEDCEDYADWDLFLKITELTPVAHIPIFGFSELSKKAYLKGKERAEANFIARING